MKKRTVYFYAIFPPLAVLANLAFAFVLFSRAQPSYWTEGLEITTGAFCCFVAGVLAATAWSRSYWGRAMSRQILVWRQIADTIVRWIEEVQLPAESLQRLKRSLDEVAPTGGPG